MISYVILEESYHYCYFSCIKVKGIYTSIMKAKDALIDLSLNNCDILMYHPKKRFYFDIDRWVFNNISDYKYYIEEWENETLINTYYFNIDYFIKKAISTGANFEDISSLYDTWKYERNDQIYDLFDNEFKTYTTVINKKNWEDIHGKFFYSM